MIVSFFNQGTEDVYNGQNTKAARRACPVDLVRTARRKLDLLNAAVSLDGMRLPPGNQLEALSGDRRGQHSIRINRQYRICFTWTAEGPSGVEINNHYR